MKSYLGISGAKAAKVIVVLVFMCGVLLWTTDAYSQLSLGPRQTGEEVLRELLMGSNKFIVCVESNGCTDKASFKVDVKKEKGLSSRAPHYVLSVIRIRPDECKAIVPDGTMVVFDLAKDLGLEGDFSYSLTNRVFVSSRTEPSDESLMSVVEKYFTVKSSEIQQTEPKPDKAAEAESPSESLLLYLNGGRGDPNIIQKFIDQGADVNTPDESLITP